MTAPTTQFFAAIKPPARRPGDAAAEANDTPGGNDTTGGNHTNAAATMIESLERQRAIYEKLAALSARQSELVAQDQPEALLGILAGRQKLIEQLKAARARIEPFKADWATFTAGLGEPVRRQINGLIDSIESLRDAIVAQDERDRLAMEKARDRLRSELGRVTQTGRARAAYHQAAPQSQNRFTDRQG